jgi:hypothetical protein
MDVTRAILVWPRLRDRREELSGWRPYLDLGAGFSLKFISEVLLRVMFEVLLEGRFHKSSKLLLASFIQICQEDEWP